MEPASSADPLKWETLQLISEMQSMGYDFQREQTSPEDIAFRDFIPVFSGKGLDWLRTWVGVMRRQVVADAMQVDGSCSVFLMVVSSDFFWEHAAMHHPGLVSRLSSTCVALTGLSHSLSVWKPFFTQLSRRWNRLRGVDLQGRLAKSDKSFVESERHLRCAHISGFVSSLELINRTALLRTELAFARCMTLDVSWASSPPPSPRGSPEQSQCVAYAAQSRVGLYSIEQVDDYIKNSQLRSVPWVRVFVRDMSMDELGRVDPIDLFKLICDACGGDSRRLWWACYSEGVRRFSVAYGQPVVGVSADDGDGAAAMHTLTRTPAESDYERIFGPLGGFVPDACDRAGDDDQQEGSGGEHDNAAEYACRGP